LDFEIPDSGLQGGNTFADGVLDQPGQGMEIQFFHEVLTMGFDGFDTEMESGGDLTSGFPFRQ
jgi:hypothetical protein